MKTLTVKDSLGNKYTLEFNRSTVALLERQGFSISKITEMPMTMLPTLFAGSFLMHHKKTKPETIDAVYKGLNDKQGLIGKLIDMYNDPIEELFDESEDDNDKEGNASWEASW